VGKPLFRGAGGSVMEEIVFRLFFYRKLIAYGEKTYIFSAL
jgi:hypothetical protein